MTTDSGAPLETGAEAAASALLSDRVQVDEPAGKSSSSTERVRRYRERKRRSGSRERASSREVAPTESVDLTPTEAEAATSGAMGGVVWDLVVVGFSNGRMRPLDDAQRRRFGLALAPLVKKYLPLLADWQYEIAAVMLTAELIRECRVQSEGTADAGGPAGSGNA